MAAITKKKRKRRGREKEGERGKREGREKRRKKRKRTQHQLAAPLRSVLLFYALISASGRAEPAKLYFFM